MKDENRKKVYLKPAWKPHIGYHLRELIPYPPEGYEFIVTRSSLKQSIAERASKKDLWTNLYTKTSGAITLPLILVTLDSFLGKTPKDIDLVFSDLPLLKRIPWVMEVAEGIATHPFRQLFKKEYIKLVEKAFSSEYCRKVFHFSEFARQVTLSNLHCSRFEHKLEVLPRAVHRKDFVKRFNEGVIRLLFMGSANAAGEFEHRGGKEALEAFNLLSRKYDDLELVIRSVISQSVKDKYEKVLSMPNVRVVEEMLPFEELEEIYKSADIFLFPGHYGNWLINLEAMSYELPVIATDLQGIPEWVENGKTGLLITRSQKVPYFWKGVPSTSLAFPPFRKALKSTDPKMVDDLVEKASVLIENPKLRKEMGEAGRWEIEHGKLSIENRNRVLKRVFDEATA